MSKPAFPFDPTYPSTNTRPGLPESTTGKWYPYRSAGDFDANLAMILVILLCALMCALALNAIIRCFFKWSRRRASLDRLPETSPGKLAYQVPAVLPTLIYSSGMKLAGAEAECAICLSEFVNGESVRVLPRCKHGFHVRCIEGWLVGHSSCPTCRASCQPNPSEKISGSASVAVSAAVENSPETLPQGSSVP